MNGKLAAVAVACVGLMLVGCQHKPNKLEDKFLKELQLPSCGPTCTVSLSVGETKVAGAKPNIIAISDKDLQIGGGGGQPPAATGAGRANVVVNWDAQGSPWSVHFTGRSPCVGGADISSTGPVKQCVVSSDTVKKCYAPLCYFPYSPTVNGVVGPDPGIAHTN